MKQNEKRVLRQLISDGRKSDAAIARELKLTQQSVYRIRERLESTGVINSYVPVVDLKKIGIQIISLAGLKISINNDTEKEAITILMEKSFIFSVIRTPGSESSHLAFMCFSDIEEKDRSMRILEYEDIVVKWSYDFPVLNITLHTKKLFQPR